MSTNERKTENIVRDILRDYKKEFDTDKQAVIIEEQKSDNVRIDKLLQYASKKGGGIGRPEFIISFSNKNDVLIVIECKGDTKISTNTQGMLLMVLFYIRHFFLKNLRSLL
jgi:type I restriction enzyme M protein